MHDAVDLIRAWRAQTACRHIPERRTVRFFDAAGYEFAALYQDHRLLGAMLNHEGWRALNIVLLEADLPDLLLRMRRPGRSTRTMPLHEAAMLYDGFPRAHMLPPRKAVLPGLPVQEAI